MRKTVGYGIVLSLLIGGLGFCYSFARSFDLVTSSKVTAWTTDHRADCGVVLTGGPRRIPDAFEQLFELVEGQWCYVCPWAFYFKASQTMPSVFWHGGGSCCVIGKIDIQLEHISVFAFI